MPPTCRLCLRARTYRSFDGDAIINNSNLTHLIQYYVPVRTTAVQQC